MPVFSSSETSCKGASKTASMSSRGMLPGRNKIAPPVSGQPMTVDSSPKLAAPPSRMQSMSSLSPKPSTTCSACVGESRPEGFAEGAAIAPPKARSSFCATGCAGTRSARVSSPALAKAETGASTRLRITKLKPPGQKRSASRRAVGVSTPKAKASSMPAT